MAWRRGKAYSQDLRDRVLQAAEEQDLAVGQIAERLSVSISYVSKVLSRYRLSGERAARPQRCHVPRKLAPYHDILREQVKAQPDATLEELRAWLLDKHQVAASRKLIWEALARLRLTLKKRPCTRPNRTDRMSPRPAGSGVSANPA
jgi:transposase